VYCQNRSRNLKDKFSIWYHPKIRKYSHLMYVELSCSFFTSAVITAGQMGETTKQCVYNTPCDCGYPFEAWMFVCVYSVFVLSCAGSGLATG
jgi:hypothetical protein